MEKSQNVEIKSAFTPLFYYNRYIILLCYLYSFIVLKAKKKQCQQKKKNCFSKKKMYKYNLGLRKITC